jgi:virulence-associated protein VagC
MAQVAKTKVFTSGGSQVVVIPEVFIRRDQQSEGLILCEAPSWNEIFAALDKAGVPDDFMSHRDQAGPQEPDEP